MERRLGALGRAMMMVLFMAAFAATPVQAAERPTVSDLVLRGDAKCTRCHDQSEDAIPAIGKTKHGTRADGRTPSCINCHGESDRHVNRPADAKERPKPDRLFGRKAGASPARIQNGACLTCHQGGNRISWQSSTHASRDVACASCHQVHTAHDKVRDKATQTETCFSCHKEQRAQVNRPSHHPVIEGKMSCSSCHNVHGDNPKQLVRASVNETCVACHMEKRGPFVHIHPPVAEDCTICHQPHGTTIANLLKARPPFLCQECHSHTSHPSQASGLPTGRTSTNSLIGSVARGCLNCHTNIHGSNSSQNSATVGRFRR